MHCYCQELGSDCYLFFFSFVTKVWPLIVVRVSFPLYILKLTETNHFCVYVDFDKVTIGVGLYDLSRNCSRVITHN